MIFPYALFKLLFLFSEEDDIESQFIDYLEAHGLSGETIDEYLIKLDEYKKKLEEEYLEQQNQDPIKPPSPSLVVLTAQEDEYEDIFDENGMWIGKKKLPPK
jgi:DNA-binding transcriptional MerR regulator